MFGSTAFSYSVSAGGRAALMIGLAYNMPQITVSSCVEASLQIYHPSMLLACVVSRLWVRLFQIHSFITHLSVFQY